MENTYILLNGRKYNEMLSLGVDYFEVLPETVEHHTGWYDDNNNAIFEGDIVEVTRTG